MESLKQIELLRSYLYVNLVIPIVRLRELRLCTLLVIFSRTSDCELFKKV
jgi:hypothetical protein